MRNCDIHRDACLSKVQAWEGSGSRDFRDSDQVDILACRHYRMPPICSSRDMLMRFHEILDQHPPWEVSFQIAKVV